MRRASDLLALPTPPRGRVSAQKSSTRDVVESSAGPELHTGYRHQCASYPHYRLHLWAEAGGDRVAMTAITLVKPSATFASHRRERKR